MHEQSITVRIEIEQRDGHIYISSRDVPGLYLWGDDPEEIVKSVIPAIKSLFRYNKGLEVDVSPGGRTPQQRWSGIERVPTDFVVREISASRTAL